MYPCSKVEHLPKRKPDYIPIKIIVQKQVHVGRRTRKRRRGSRFEKEWLRDDECSNIVSDAWHSTLNSDVDSKIYFCAEKLNSWSVKRSTDFGKEVLCRREKIGMLMKDQTTPETMAEIRTLDTEIDELKRREETYWAQRSRQD
ncbi:hypothetical protein POM88_052649 [Heracleum sosnowskyi]|uniref:Uncharacterized protein n=1 Tax=Heracleum sosnowskyi TaxID=360622 RepID=A0AAD8GRN3_9APIA|nr:hypothetical protein POM88_052649 [Heracleum sosnowskyi]